ncbi:MAG: response regulator, partial [Deltaproteobacteria bacterium]|nr:response regulator [Deltaproteobacteria bacterium]
MSDKQKVLIVDDKAENLCTLEKVLKVTDAELIKAQSGNEALKAVLNDDFALAIFDVQMPNMDGYELAELLRADPKTWNLPIIFLTATSPEDKQIFKGYESGAVDYIVKPYNPAILVSKVKVFIELHAQKVELHRNREQLTAVNKELEAFAYSVSHDLRAPLRAIEGFSQALLEDCPDKLDEQEKDYLQRVASEVRRMARLIDDLLALSRLTRAEMRIERVNLSELAQEIVARLREAEPGRDVKIVIADDLFARGDLRLLGQALENLLSNAWKFTCRSERARIEL